MNETMSVRRFAPGDLDAVRGIYLASRRFAFPWMDVDSFTLGDYDTATEGEAVWVVDSGHDIIGFASVWEPDNFLHNLFVHPDYIGQGIGSKLLNAVIKNLKRPVSLKCAQRNTAALGFYLHHGWVIKDESVGPEGEYFFMSLPDEPSGT